MLLMYLPLLNHFLVVGHLVRIHLSFNRYDFWDSRILSMTGFWKWFWPQTACIYDSVINMLQTKTAPELDGTGMWHTQTEFWANQGNAWSPTKRYILGGGEDKMAEWAQKHKPQPDSLLQFEYETTHPHTCTHACAHVHTQLMCSLPLPPPPIDGCS